MKKDLVSVVVPAHNQAAFISETLESIHAQTHRPLEVVVVDDGSHDNTAATAQKWAGAHAASDFNVTVVSQKNAGVIAACDAAFSHTTGKYVVRIDGDDTIPAEYIAVLYRALHGAGSRIAYAYCDAKYFGARTGDMPSAPFSLTRLVTENYIHVSALVRRDVIEKLGYFSPTMSAGFEDWDFWLKLAEYSYSGVYCADTFLNYRQHGQASRNAMSAETHRKLRKQVQINHPGLYKKPWVQGAVRLWQVRRRARRYLGMAG